MYNLLKTGHIGEMHTARVADRFRQQFEFEIRQHVDHALVRSRGALGFQLSAWPSLRRHFDFLSLEMAGVPATYNRPAIFP